MCQTLISESVETAGSMYARGRHIKVLVHPKSDDAITLLGLVLTFNWLSSNSFSSNLWHGHGFSVNSYSQR